MKNHPETDLVGMHLSDEMLKLLASGKINNRLLCEIATHKDFQRLMVDTQICVDRIAAMLVHDLNVVLAEARKTVMEKHNPGENGLYMRTLELAQIDENEYFSRVVHDDLDVIIRDIREAHKKNSTTADEVNPSDTARQALEEAMSYEGSPEERQARIFCKQLGINYNKLTKEVFFALINILKKSSLLKGQPNKRGKSRPIGNRPYMEKNRYIAHISVRNIPILLEFHPCQADAQISFFQNFLMSIGPFVHSSIIQTSRRFFLTVELLCKLVQEFPDPYKNNFLMSKRKHKKDQKTKRFIK